MARKLTSEVSSARRVVYVKSEPEPARVITPVYKSALEPLHPFRAPPPARRRPNQEKILMEMTNDELRERLELLKAIKELEDRMPDEDEMRAAADHLGVLQEIERLEGPGEDDIKDCAGHLAVLQEIDKLEGPNEEEIQDAKDHLATLQAIEEHEEAA
jgi:hypothetical protein